MRNLRRSEQRRIHILFNLWSKFQNWINLWRMRRNAKGFECAFLQQVRKTPRKRVTGDK